jgi:hypothetical protein
VENSAHEQNPKIDPMKKISTLFVSILCLMALGVQLKAQSNPLFANDIKVELNTMANQRNVRIASASNGWLFAAYIVNDSVSQKGGVVVRFSKNGGINWSPFNGYAYNQHSYYLACDISVAGLDSNHLYVFVGTVRKDLKTRRYEVNVEKYSATRLAITPVSVYFQQLDTNRVMDIALTSDYHFPAAKDSIYSVGMIYSHSGGLFADTLVFADTHKYGAKFAKAHRIAHTSSHYRKVALSYMRSPSSSRGAYVAAWEQIAAANSTLGHIYTARTAVNIDSVWTTPVCLDSLSPTTNGFVRSPSIAGQVNNFDNDSANVTAVVVFDCARNGRTDSLDILGYYNKRADSTSFWNLFPVAATTNNELQSGIDFDISTGNFILTYYDSTAGGLPYLRQPFNMPSPGMWTVSKTNYSDNASLLKAPWPRVVMVAPMNKAFFAWVNDPANKNGVVMCDGEYLFTGIAPEVNEGGLKIYALYPNPTATTSYLPVSVNTSTKLKLAVYNILGELVLPEEAIQLNAGTQNIEMHTESLQSGIYLVHVWNGNVVHTSRLSVQHR